VIASHIVNYAKHQHSPFARRRHDFRQAAARRFKLHFPHLSFGELKVSWKSIQPFLRTVVSYLTVGKNKKSKKTPVKHTRYRLISGCVNQCTKCNMQQNGKRCNIVSNQNRTFLGISSPTTKNGSKRTSGSLFIYNEYQIETVIKLTSCFTA